MEQSKTPTNVCIVMLGFVAMMTIGFAAGLAGYGVLWAVDNFLR